ARRSSYRYLFRTQTVGPLASAGRPVSRTSRSERHPRGLPLARVVHLEQGRRLEPEHTGDQVGRERLALVVVVHDRVVVVLAGERDAVLGGGQLLRQLHHVLVGLQVGVGLGQREQPPQGLGQHVLRAGQLSHGGRVTRVDL